MYSGATFRLEITMTGKDAILENRLCDCKIFGGVLGPSKLGSSKNLKINSDLFEGKSYKNTKLWVAKVILFFQTHVYCWEEQKKFALVQYMHVTTLLEIVNRALEHVS